MIVGKLKHRNTSNAAPLRAFFRHYAVGYSMIVRKNATKIAKHIKTRIFPVGRISAPLMALSKRVAWDAEFSEALPCPYQVIKGLNDG